jgi:DNA-binding CsgD family transcriptional regulator
MSDFSSFQTMRPSTAPLTGRTIRLTQRQFEVLWLLCEGLPNKLISRKLNISSATVKVHVSSILRALNVSTRLQAVLTANQLGLLAGAPSRTPDALALADRSHHVGNHDTAEPTIRRFGLVLTGD